VSESFAIDPGERRLPDFVAVGSGIQACTDLSNEARSFIGLADNILYLAQDPINARLIRSMRPDAESLGSFYSPTTPRELTYAAMAERALELLREGKRVCMVLPGHPGVFAQPALLALHAARAEGFRAHMAPAISAQDRLFCDLGVDPGEHGCYSCDASDFLMFERRPDPSSMLILWQIGVIGVACQPQGVDRAGLRLLRDYLMETLPSEHVVTVYEAAFFVLQSPSITSISLARLDEAPVTQKSTLYVPIVEPPRPSRRMIERMLARSSSSALSSRRT
jgi:uncharacterized protein YabN with tetrapyrrole methylase and pyrophosphatase domain